MATSSDASEDFDKVFADFIAYLKRNHDLVSLSASFSPSQSDLALIKFASRLLNEWPDFKKVLLLKSSNKDDDLSKKYRSLGNPFYGKKQYLKALEHYNACIRYAQHPDDLVKTTGNRQPVENDNESVNKCSSILLSLGYANRSAVLFDLKLYKLAHGDIQRSLCYGYPNAKNKLIVRKVKCLIQLSAHGWLQHAVTARAKTGSLYMFEVQNDCIELASEQFLEILSAFDDVKLSISENSDLNTYIKSAIESFTSINFENYAKEYTSSDQKGHLPHSVCLEHSVQSPAALSNLSPVHSSLLENTSLSVTGPCLPIPWYVAAELPALETEHENIRGLSAAVGMAYDPTKGRHLVARQDILPGTVLAVDHGYKSGVVLPSHSTSVCCTCLTFCIAPLPCTGCTMVVFCSEKCRAVGASSHHGRECGLLSTLRLLDMGRNTELALRMVTNHDLCSLKQLLHACEHETSVLPPATWDRVNELGARNNTNPDFSSKSTEEPKEDLSSEGDFKRGLHTKDEPETPNAEKFSCCTPTQAVEADDEGPPLSKVGVQSCDASSDATEKRPEGRSFLSLHVGFAPDGVYGSRDYRSIYHLVGNKTSRVVADLFKRSVMACVVLKLLEKSGYFARPASSSHENTSLGVSDLQLRDEATAALVGPNFKKINGNYVDDTNMLPSVPSDRELLIAASSSCFTGAKASSNIATNEISVTNIAENSTTSFSVNNVSSVKDILLSDMVTAENDSESDMMTVGSVLLRHMLNLPCNAHSVTLFHLDANNLLNSRSEEVGAGAFGVLSLTNHSCSPNCYRQSYGRVGVLRAIEFIPRGTEISDCYGAHFALDTRPERQLTLKKQYYFDCGCDACVSDWHRISCNCRLCIEIYCKNCDPLCKDSLCRKSVETLPFKLKCLRRSCRGVMHKATNRCSECRLPYDANSPVIQAIMSLSSAMKTTSMASKALHMCPKKQNTSAIDTNKNLYSNEVDSRYPLNGRAANKCLPQTPSPETNDANAPKSDAKTTPGVETTSVLVASVVDVLEGLLSEYESACRAVVGGRGSDGSEGAVERAVAALSALAVRPNKQLLRAQELLKHCYDRKASRLLLPSTACAP